MAPLFLASALLLAQAQADLDWAPDRTGVAAVWTEDRREQGFQTRRRGPDLWMNKYLPESEAASLPFGRIVCAASVGETMSSPRIAMGAQQSTVVWKVTTATGDELRASPILDTGLMSCSTVMYRAPANVEIGSVQVETLAGMTLVTWETQNEFMGMFLEAPGLPAFTIYAKSSGGNDLGPSLTAVTGGFYLAWAESRAFKGLFITRTAGGPQYNAVTSSFPLVTLTGPPVVTGFPLTAVFVGREALSITDTLQRGRPGIGAVLDVLDTPGPAATPGPLVMARSPVLDGHFVTWGDSSGFTLVDFVPDGGVTSRRLPAGLTPVAMAAAPPSRTVLMGFDEHPSFLPLAAPLTNTTNLDAGLALQPEPDQLLHSAVFMDAGVWVVVANSSLGALARPLSPDGTVGNRTLALDGGLGLLHVMPWAQGPGIAVNIENSAGTAIFPENFDGSAISPTPLLYTPLIGLSAGVAGHGVSALWKPGGSDLVVGSGYVAVADNLTATRFGRCGAYAESTLLVPAMVGTELKVVMVPDDGGVRSVGSLGTQSNLVDVCLVANGSELLLVGTDVDDLLVFARTSVAALRANEPRLGTSVQPVLGRPVVLPVAAPTPAGWLLAWESPDVTGGALYGAKLGLNDVRLNAVAMLNSPASLDERAPVLSASPGGGVLLAWQQFTDTTGNVIVKARVLQQPVVVRDAGIEPVDGGVKPNDAGISDSDAGVKESDGGVVASTPLVFTSCGCGSGGGPMLLGLVLLLGASRRRRSASPPTGERVGVRGEPPSTAGGAGSRSDA